MLLQNPSNNGATVTDAGTQKHNDENVKSCLKDVEGHKIHMLDYAPAPGWTVHVTNEGRLYYCK